MDRMHTVVRDICVWGPFHEASNTLLPPPFFEESLKFTNKRLLSQKRLHLYLQNFVFQDCPDTLKIWLSWSISPFPLKSGLRSMNSAKMHPTDHMSTAVEYSCGDGGKWREGRERGGERGRKEKRKGERGGKEERKGEEEGREERKGGRKEREKEREGGGRGAQ